MYYGQCNDLGKGSPSLLPTRDVEAAPDKVIFSDQVLLNFYFLFLFLFFILRGISSPLTIFFTTICLALFVFFIYSIKHILIFIKEEHFLLRLVQTFYFTTFRRSTMEAGRERDYVKKSNFCHWIFVKGIFYHIWKYKPETSLRYLCYNHRHFEFLEIMLWARRHTLHVELLIVTLVKNPREGFNVKYSIKLVISKFHQKYRFSTPTHKHLIFLVASLRKIVLIGIKFVS